MEIYQRNKREQKAYDKAMRSAKFKRELTLLKAKLLGKKLDPNDKMTIQARLDAEGTYRNYYIADGYIQNLIGPANYTSIVPIIEDEEKGKFVYRGLVGGANNATGVIESNVPISEIVASPYGNEVFTQMLSGKNALSVCQNYYEQIGESLDPIKGGTSYFGKREFPLGTITKDKKGRFSYVSSVSQEIENLLEEGRNEEDRISAMQEEDSIQMKLGNGLTVARQDCWMEQGKGIKFNGINADALFYQFTPGQPIKTDDGTYVYVGDLSIGKSNIERQDGNQPIKFISPFIYENVVLYTEGKNLIQYFMNNKLQGLNFALGRVFTNDNVKIHSKDNSPNIIGGIYLDENGECQVNKNIPESVKEVADRYLRGKASRDGNIINLEDFRDR